MPSTTSSSPLTRSTLAVPRQEASPFRSCCVCASLLKATLYPCVCTQIPLLLLTLCSRAVVFEPSWPLACIKQLVLFLFVVLCCDIHRNTLISIMYPACMITVHDRKSRALQKPKKVLCRACCGSYMAVIKKCSSFS